MMNQQYHRGNYFNHHPSPGWVTRLTGHDQRLQQQQQHFASSSVVQYSSLSTTSSMMNHQGVSDHHHAHHGPPGRLPTRAPRGAAHVATLSDGAVTGVPDYTIVGPSPTSTVNGRAMFLSGRGNDGNHAASSSLWRLHQVQGSSCVPSPNDAGSQCDIEYLRHLQIPVLASSSTGTRLLERRANDAFIRGIGERLIMSMSTTNQRTSRNYNHDGLVSSYVRAAVAGAATRPSQPSQRPPRNASNNSNNGASIENGNTVASGTTATSSSSMAPKRARKGRAKTELCQHYMRRGTCPFKEMCSYAHGHHELRSARLKDVVQDLDEAFNFRCLPCQTFVATGSCPYHSRCHFLHDPRVAGPFEAALSCKDMPTRQLSYSSVVIGGNNDKGMDVESSTKAEGSNLDKVDEQKNNKKSIAVAGSPSSPVSVIDRSYNVRNEVLVRGNPFGLPSEKTMSFKALRDAVCNLTIGNLKTTIQAKITRPDIMGRLVGLLNQASSRECNQVLSERHRLEIILHMRESAAAAKAQFSHNDTYEFWPTHMLFDQEGCMILQRKVFAIIPLPLLSSSLSNHIDSRSVVCELKEGTLPYQVYHSSRRDEMPLSTVEVFELAFGPEQKKNVLPVSYWFGLEEAGRPGLPSVGDLQPITAYNQAKRIVDEIKTRNKAGMMTYKKRCAALDDDSEDDDYATDDDYEDSTDDDSSSTGIKDVVIVPNDDVPVLHFTTATPFFEVRTKDEATYNLISKMMYHRLHSVSYHHYYDKTYNDGSIEATINGQDADAEHESLYHSHRSAGRSSLMTEYCLMQRLLYHEQCSNDEENIIRMEYENHRKHWIKWWMLPRAGTVTEKEGSRIYGVTRNELKGPVPSGNCEYNFPSSSSVEGKKKVDRYGSKPKKHLEVIWNSFVQALNENDTTSSSNFKSEKSHSLRLPFFQGLTSTTTKQDEELSTNSSFAKSSKQSNQRGFSGGSRLGVFQALASVHEDHEEDNSANSKVIDDVDLPMPQLSSKTLGPIGPFDVGHKMEK